jgi:dihydrofolate reductase
MAKIIVNLSLTLDGVMQAPGRPDEDTRRGFQYGGWAGPYFDPVMAGNAAEGIATQPALLFGRRTYEDFYAVWPNQTDNMFTEVLNNTRKYVVSNTLKEPLPWMNSTLLPGDAAPSVAALKQQSQSDLLILGSGALVRSLLRQNLVDELALSIHPLVLGAGQRLFTEDGPYAAFQLVGVKPTTTGVLLATYRLSP